MSPIEKLPHLILSACQFAAAIRPTSRRYSKRRWT